MNTLSHDYTAIQYCKFLILFCIKPKNENDDTLKIVVSIAPKNEVAFIFVIGRYIYFYNYTRRDFLIVQFFIFFNALFRSIPLPNTPLKRSPVSFTLSIAFFIVKSDIFNPFFTSSQCNGIETVAPCLGLNE